jgi:hypothetical protein
MARRAWHCEHCDAELGRVTTDREGREHLKAYADQVTGGVVPVVSGAVYEVMCRCGAVRKFEGKAVHLEPRIMAA